MNVVSDVAGRGRCTFTFVADGIAQETAASGKVTFAQGGACGVLGVVVGQPFAITYIRGIPQIVGGEILGIDMDALFIAGAAANGYWVLPIFAGIAGAISALIVRRKRRI